MEKDKRKQFQGLNIVLNNKNEPLFLRIQLIRKKVLAFIKIARLQVVGFVISDSKSWKYLVSLFTHEYLEMMI